MCVPIKSYMIVRQSGSTCGVCDRIMAMLQDNDIPFRHIRHRPVFTSQEAAVARGESLDIGGKALVVKVDEQFRLFVLSAALRLDSKLIKRYFAAKAIRFASADELRELTGLVPGSVPPFGEPILPLTVHADPSVFMNRCIAFNAGSLTDSLVMSSSDYDVVAKPSVFQFGAR